MRINKVPVLGSLLLLAGPLLASDYDNRTEITFHEPVMIAGVPVVTLEPGKYVIRLSNHDHDRSIVQVLNEREDRLFTTALALRIYRLVPEDKTTFTFWETPRGNPIALRAWFSARDQWGQEFVYPAGLAAIIARETGERVLTSPAKTVAEFGTAPVTETTKSGKEQPLGEALTAPAPRR